MVELKEEEEINHSSEEEDEEEEDEDEDEEETEVSTPPEPTESSTEIDATEKNPEKPDEESDSDEEPEDVSLSESKKRAVEGQRKQNDFSKNLRQQKKKTLQERQIRNKEQRGSVRREKKSFLPEQLDDNILELVDEDIEVDIPTDSVTQPKERKNTKIVFSDGDEDEEEEDDFFEEEEVEEERGSIEARCLKNVEKSRANNSAEEFLKSHFFGDRVKRDDLTLSAPHNKRKAGGSSNCNVAWLKKRK